MASEATIQQKTRLEAANNGLLMYHNNVGACLDNTGRMIRYGLGNDSAQLNAVIKSSDLIGITPVTAFLASTGRWETLGVFTAFEIKASGWLQQASDERANAQAKFHAIVREAGGFAGFVTAPGEIHSIIRRF